ncbi:cystinosin homolog isoform X7 [Prunus avium]|uniref:Cystinosin homolog isoform X7 n=1 Tax=Prunus avium TaxID=42229 RepID=A0A6P5SJ63_PRUAV|nr:cystinosin homolog isoform X7 [Prunus avium]
MDGFHMLVRRLLPTNHIEFPPEKRCGFELRFRGAEFDKAFFLSHLQRHPLLQLRRSKAVLGEIRMIPVAVNDVAFSAHAVLMTAIILFQIAIYDRGTQKVSKIAIGIVVAVWFGAAVCFFVALPTHSWLWLINIFNSIQVFMTVVKYTPQAFMNFMRKSTDGFSIGFYLLDFSGGVTNYAQMAVLSIDQDSWVNFYGNMGKVLLSLISISFDILFMCQRFLLYPSKKAPIPPPPPPPQIISKESLEPLLQSSTSASPTHTV